MVQQRELLVHGILVCSTEKDHTGEQLQGVPRCRSSESTATLGLQRREGSHRGATSGGAEMSQQRVIVVKSKANIRIKDSDEKTHQPIHSCTHLSVAIATHPYSTPSPARFPSDTHNSLPLPSNVRKSSQRSHPARNRSSSFCF